MPVKPSQDPTTVFKDFADDLTAAAAEGGAIIKGGGLASLGGTLDTTAFVAPVEADMESVESTDSCGG